MYPENLLNIFTFHNWTQAHEYTIYIFSILLVGISFESCSNCYYWNYNDYFCMYNSFLLDIYFGVKLLDLEAGNILALGYIANFSSECLHHVTLPPASYESPSWFMKLPKWVLSILLILDILVGVWWFSFSHD